MHGQLVHQSMPEPRRKITGRLDYWLIFSACFAVFLPVTLVKHAIPRHWTSAAEEPRRLSIISDAWETAHECAALAFSG
jgi:hypothetical protein